MSADTREERCAAGTRGRQVGRVNAVAEDRRFSSYRFNRAGAGRSRPDRFGGQFASADAATSDEPERQVKLPGEGLARRR